MYLLPNLQPGTKKIQDGCEVTNIYSLLTEDDKSYLVDGFLKFIEICINRVRRMNTCSKKKVGSAPIHGGFRERVGSNRLGESPRSRFVYHKSIETQLGGFSYRVLIINHFQVLVSFISHLSCS